jgi:hypothetical protein
VLPTSNVGKDSHSGDKVTVEGVDVQQASQQVTKQVVEAEERRDQVEATDALEVQSHGHGGWGDEEAELALPKVQRALLDYRKPWQPK